MSGSIPDRGVSQLPISKVNKLIKADKDIKLCSKEAIFLISKTTEFMIGKLTSSAYSTARMQGRSKLVKYQDVAQVVNGSEAKNWFYLSEVVPSSLPLAEALFQRAQAEQEDNQAALPIAGSSEVHVPITKAGRPKKVKKAAPSSGGSGTPKVKKVKATVPADIISPGGTKQRAKRTKKESLAGRRLEEALADEQEDEREMDEEEREEGGWVPEAEGMDIDD